MNTDKIYAESIAKEYAPKEHSKITALKKLDQRAKLPANIFAYTFGILSSLIAGLGMSFAMGKLGEGMLFMVLGIVLGVIGFTGAAVTYPIYQKLLEKGKQKYAFEIIELAKEISGEE